MDTKTTRRYSQVGLWTEERLGWLMTSAASRWPDKEFICIGDRRCSYLQVYRWIIATAQDLVRRGIGPGDRVLVQLGNCIELVVMQMAAWRIGAVSVPVVPIYREHEMRHICSDSKPHAVVSMNAFRDRSPTCEFDRILAEGPAVPVARIAVGADGSDGWDPPLQCPDASACISERGLPEPAPADVVSLILYTSGTTSSPKGAMLSGRALLSNADNWRLSLQLSADDVAFGGASIAHIAALCSAVLAPLRTGGRTVILEAWKPDLAAHLISREGATFMAGAAVFLQDLVEQYEAGMAPAPNLMFISGGAATPNALVERADKVGVTAVRCWGMTETSGTCTLAPRDAPLHRRSQWDGRVVFGTELKIVDDDGRAMPHEELGHVLVRSPQMMIGYTDPALTMAQLDSDGWFRTGDMGTVDDEGWFCMHGRTKDIINRAGEKFSARDIESALESFSSVLNAAVVGVPHARLGEDVAACLVLKQGACWSGPQSLIEHLVQLQLAKQKIPTRWLVLERLPMTASGKVQKQVLLQLLDEAERPRPAG